MFFRKEIKIIRIIFSEIKVFCFKQHLIFWGNYDNYYNFFPKKIMSFIPSYYFIVP
jgi:hypothetical protein